MPSAAKTAILISKQISYVQVRIIERRDLYVSSLHCNNTARHRDDKYSRRYRNLIARRVYAVIVNDLYEYYCVRVGGGLLTVDTNRATKTPRDTPVEIFGRRRPMHAPIKLPVAIRKYTNGPTSGDISE